MLSINADDLLIALRERNPQVESWLDRVTGEIYQISALFADDEAEDDPAFARMMLQSPERFLRLPVSPPALAFQAMQAFVETVAESALQSSLRAALARQRAFFHFQDVLTTSPAEAARWQHHIRVLLLQWADGWLQQQGVVRQL